MSASPSAVTPFSSTHLSVSISNDALSVVFTFLDRASLNTALAVCKRWSALVLTMRSVGFNSHYYQNPSLLPLVYSPFARRHVGSLSLAHHSMEAEEIAVLEPMTQLRELSFTVSALGGHQSHVWTFPPSLHVLTLEDGLDEEDGPATRAGIIRAIAQLPLLHTLSLGFLFGEGAIVAQPVYDIAPLAALPCLTHLAIDYPIVTSMTDALRQFPALEHLSLYRGTDSQLTEFIERLTMPPHTLRLQHLIIPIAWTDQITEALTRVPTITEIGGRFDSVSSLHFLTSFPQMTSLALDTLDPERITPQHLVEALVALPRLTRLFMVLPTLNCADLTRVLLALPELTVLEFDTPSKLESLRCFAEAAPTLSRSLTRLALYALEHPALNTAEFEHLRALSQLTYLCLEYAREGLIDEAMKQALTPPSIWLPKLTRFESLQHAPLLLQSLLNRMSWTFGTAGASAAPVGDVPPASGWPPAGIAGVSFGSGVLVDGPSFLFGTGSAPAAAAAAPLPFMLPPQGASSLFDARPAAAKPAPVDFTPRCRSEVAPASGLPPSLHADTFFSVSQFLEIAELARLLQVSCKHSWGEMIRSMPRVLCAFHLHSEVFPFVSLIADVTGPLARHIGDLRVSVLLAPPDIGVLTDRFPHLRSLDITVHVKALMNNQPHPTTPWRFPAGLHSLTLRSILDGGVGFFSMTGPKRFPVYGLDALTDLETLELQVGGVDIKPLLSCPRLTHLTLPWSYDPAGLEVLCALPVVRRLSFTRCPPVHHDGNRAEHAVLGLTKASRRWEEISFDEHVRWSQAMLDAACSCSGLLKLTPGTLHAKNLDALARVPLLRELRLVFGQPMTDSDAIVRRVSACGNLMALTLGGQCSLSSADLCLLLPSLPHLSSLELRLPQLGSLEFCTFAAPTLSRTLSRLLIEYSVGFFTARQAVIAPLASLRQLRDLEFAFAQYGKREEVPGEIVQALQTPSAVVPSLRRFVYPAELPNYNSFYGY